MLTSLHFLDQGGDRFVSITIILNLIKKSTEKGIYIPLTIKRVDLSDDKLSIISRQECVCPVKVVTV